MSFKKRDMIRGLENNGYGFTNEEMILGKVIDTFGAKMKVKIISHTNPLIVGKEYEVLNSDENFELICKTIEVGNTVRINKNATIEDFTRDNWNGCQINTLAFIRKYGDTDKTFVVSEISSTGSLYLENEGGMINPAIFELVSKKEHKTKEVTMQEVCEKFGCNVVIKKEAE